MITLCAGGVQASDNKWRVDASASFRVDSKMDLQERTAYRFGFNRTIMDELASNGELSGISFLGGSYRLYSHDLQGQFDLSVDTLFLSPEEEALAQYTVFSPQLAYRSFDRKLYMDLGYAYSRYDETKISVHQWTPTFGFSVTRHDWFQFRGYVIDAYALNRGGDNTLYTAAEGSWTHRFRDNLLGLSRIKARALLGRRMYAVDQDLKTVQGLSDEQGGSLSFSMHWSLPYNWDLMFQNSIEEYYGSENPYRLNYGYFGVERRW